MKKQTEVKKFKIKRGDKVKILLGKERGKEGIVEKIMGKAGRAFVGGLNLYKRHVKKMGEMEGGIIDLPKSMDLSNIGLICPECKKVTRIGFKIEGKTKVRICKKCHKEIKN